MKTATLTRGPSTDEGTFGTLTFGDKTLRSVELPWRDNATGKSCIPVGAYRCEIVNSPRFGKVYGVLSVNGRQNILIHAANFGGNVDAGKVSDLLGCIAPAMSVGQLENRDGKQQKAGLQSRAALAIFMGWADGLPFELVIA